MRSALVLFGAVFLLAPAAAALEVGDAAPAVLFEVSTGESVALSQYVGERGVVLAWFPKAFTGG